MPLLPEGIDAIRSEEATLDLLAREYHSPPLTETLFGRQANECVIRAIEAADIFDLDSLLIQGVISTKEMYAFATASEEFQECCRSLYAAATDAAAHFDNGKRLQYTFGKFFDRNGAPKTLALAELLSEVNRSMSHIGLEKEIPFVTMRLYLLSLFRLRLWSELIHRFHTYAAESQTRLL